MKSEVEVALAWSSEKLYETLEKSELMRFFVWWVEAVEEVAVMIHVSTVQLLEVEVEVETEVPEII